jgi:hypothetical protein
MALDIDGKTYLAVSGGSAGRDTCEVPSIFQPLPSF